MKLIKKTYKDTYPASTLDDDGYISLEGFFVGLTQSWATKETIPHENRFVSLHDEVSVPVYEVDVFYHYGVYHVRLWSRGELKHEKLFCWRDEAFAFVDTVSSLLATIS